LVIRTADAIISTTNANTEILRNQFPRVDPEKFFTVTNCYTEELVQGETEKCKDKFIISYTGIFYDKKDPFTFFRALKNWFDGMDARTRKRYKELLRVQLIGSRSPAVERTINGLELQDVVVVIDRVPHAEAVRLTKSSDMVLISTGIGGRTRPGWLPSKLFEYLGCRVPILAITREGETARVIRKTNSGYVVTAEDHGAIRRILETEIQRKFPRGVPVNAPEFTFDGVAEFEERTVVSKMVEIIQKTEHAHPYF
jgi:glycosyltransferase involved in cell wall biosynthesis